MRQVVPVEPYRELADHLPRGRSFRELAAELGRSHEHWRAVCARESADLVGEVEEHLRAGLVPLFLIPFGQPLGDWQAAVTLAGYVVDELRAHGVAVHARSVSAEDGIAIEIVEEEKDP